jgi:hypothetical protein
MELAGGAGTMAGHGTMAGTTPTVDTTVGITHIMVDTMVRTARTTGDIMVVTTVPITGDTMVVGAAVGGGKNRGILGLPEARRR